MLVDDGLFYFNNKVVSSAVVSTFPGTYLFGKQSILSSLKRSQCLIICLLSLRLSDIDLLIQVFPRHPQVLLFHLRTAAMQFWSFLYRLWCSRCFARNSYPFSVSPCSSLQHEFNSTSHILLWMDNKNKKKVDKYCKSSFDQIPGPTLIIPILLWG